MKNNSKLSIVIVGIIIIVAIGFFLYHANEVSPRVNKNEYSSKVLNAIKEYDSNANFDTEVSTYKTEVNVTLIPRDSYTTNKYGKGQVRFNKNTKSVTLVLVSSMPSYIFE